MNYPRAGHAIKKVHKQIYAFGNINAPQDTAERYLLETDRWIKMPNMPIAVSHASCALFTDKVYIAGRMTSILTFKPSDRTFSKLNLSLTNCNKVIVADETSLYLL